MRQKEPFGCYKTLMTFQMDNIKKTGFSCKGYFANVIIASENNMFQDRLSGIIGTKTWTHG